MQASGFESICTIFFEVLFYLLNGGVCAVGHYESTLEKGECQFDYINPDTYD